MRHFAVRFFGIRLGVRAALTVLADIVALPTPAVTAC